MTDLFRSLDADWASFARSPAGAAALDRWRTRQPRLQAFDDLDELVAAMGDPADPDTRDEVLLAMVRIATTDHDARRAVLHVLTPGLRRVAASFQRRWGRPDTVAMTLTAALERLATYPARRSTKPAANIVWDVHHALHVAARREDALAQTIGIPEPLEHLEDQPAHYDRHPADELVGLVDDAVRSRQISRADAALIVRHRVYDDPTARIARDQGWQPSTIRKRRRRAEAALARAVA